MHLLIALTVLLELSDGLCRNRGAKKKKKLPLRTAGSPCGRSSCTSGRMQASLNFRPVHEWRAVIHGAGSVSCVLRQLLVKSAGNRETVTDDGGCLSDLLRRETRKRNLRSAIVKSSSDLIVVTNHDGAQEASSLVSRRS